MLYDLSDEARADEARAEAEAYDSNQLESIVKTHGICWVIRELLKCTPGEGFPVDEEVIPALQEYVYADINGIRRILVSLLVAMSNFQYRAPYRYRRMGNSGPEDF